MNKEVLFIERQKFNQWWLWLILLGINGVFIFGAYQQVIGGQQFGDKPMWIFRTKLTPPKYIISAATGLAYCV